LHAQYLYTKNNIVNRRNKIGKVVIVVEYVRVSKEAFAPIVELVRVGFVGVRIRDCDSNYWTF